MKKIKFKKAFRERLSEKIMDLGNIAGAAMVFGQFVSGKEFSMVVLIGGVVLILFSYITSYLVDK